jgi:hypothetical protein
MLLSECNRFDYIKCCYWILQLSDILPEMLSGKGFPTLMVNYTMGWFEQRACFIETQFWSHQLYLAREGIPNFDGQLHHEVIWRSDVFCIKIFFKPWILFGQRWVVQLWWSIWPHDGLKKKVLQLWCSTCPPGDLKKGCHLQIFEQKKKTVY